MKNFLKIFLCFILSIFVLYLFYCFVSIPIIPVYTLYLFINLSLKNNNNFKTILVFFTLLFFICIYFYGFYIYMQIFTYPEYGNWFGIICTGLTIFSFISCYIMFFLELKKEIKNEKNNFDTSSEAWQEFLEKNTINKEGTRTTLGELKNIQCKLCSKSITYNPYGVCEECQHKLLNRVKERENKQFCTKCGKEVDTSWNFCNYCGNKLK